MAEEKTNPEVKPDDNGNPTSINDMIAEALKDKVSKAEYDALKLQNDDLVKRVLNGEFSNERTPGDPPAPTKSEKEKEMKELILAFRDHKLHTPTEHVSAMLKIDEYLTEQGSRSLFEASTGDRNFNGAYEESMRVRDLLKTALEESNGDDLLLMAKVQSALRDNPR